MMIEKSGTIRLKDIHIPQGGTPEQQELAQCKQQLLAEDS